ncbi:MAG: pyruvate dehydrogenase [Isosphaera sp.]|nr:pyruvate dehydrogenase [Isosphaera sp.]
MTQPELLARPAPPAPAPLYRQAFLIRAVEERLLQLFGQGKLFGTVHTCIGQEWTGVAAADALLDGDTVFSNHRCHGHYLAWTDDADGLIAELMGRQTGVCAGRGGSQHLCGRGFFSNGIQGGIVPVAAGLALAHKLAGKGGVSAVFIGDGTLGEGAVYESLNVASRWDLPLLVLLENNRYAQSTPQDQTLAGEIPARAEAFGIEASRTGTENPARLLADVARAANGVRADGRPRFVVIDTYRLMAHSKGDDDRDPAEVAEYRERDPLTRFARDYPAEAGEMAAAAAARIDAAVAKADAAPWTTPNEAEPLPTGPVRWSRTEVAGEERAVARLHAAFRHALAADDRVVLIGEDIEGPYGGAFKVTKNLSAEFPGRVRNTPISEAAIVGVGNGLALGGYLPVCEIMFGDFLGLAFDQLLNHAAKFRYMYGGKVNTPLVVRTPMGGRRGYGPTHSQSIEKHFLGIPDTRVLALHARFDPAEVYARLFATIDRPTLVVENKLLYGAKVTHAAPAGFVYEHTDEPFPTTRLRPGADPDVTVLCYGGMLPEAEAAAAALFDEHEVAAEVICPTQLYPFDPRPLLESVGRTGRLVIAEEGPGFAAFGAEAAAVVAERAGRPVRVRRVSPPEAPIPACGPLEKTWLPGAAHIVGGVLEVTADGR